MTALFWCDAERGGGAWVTCGRRGDIVRRIVLKGVDPGDEAGALKAARKALEEVGIR